MDLTLDRAEQAGFKKALYGQLHVHWPSARAAGSNDVAVLWNLAVREGWLESARKDMLGAAVIALRVFGAVACPFPLMDAFIAVRLFPDFGAAIAAGRIRVVLALGTEDENFNHVEAASEATHLLVLDVDRSTAALREALDVMPLPGTAVPAWSRVTAAAAAGAVTADAAAFDEAVTLVRFGLAVRALAAAGRAHELAIQHAGMRRQFGRVIGAFGAVQQRIASCQIDVIAGGLLVDRAVQGYETSAPDWQVAAEIAVTFIAAAARRVQLGAHHTLAAAGFFEEHEAPWLFRRVHADIASLMAWQKPGGVLGDLLVESERSLPRLDEDPATGAFRARLRAALDAGCGGREHFGFGAPDPRVVATLADGGFLGMGWPVAWGGREASAAEQTALLEELHYRRLGAWQTTGAVMLLGDAILRHGSAAQKERFLPLIRAGQLRFCLGYSEAEAGSDLASLRTRAVLDGAEWVIDGQKLWTSGADHSDWVWLAARTSEKTVPPHAGITIFLLPMSTPGISVVPHRALSGEISCTVTYDQVRVPDSARVGAVDGGWRVITDAMAGERVSLGSVAASLHWQLDELLRLVRARPALAGDRGSAARASLARVAADIQATRVLVSAGVAASGSAAAARLHAPMAKVMSGETAEAFAETALDILGPDALLGTGVAGVPGGGWFDYGLRLAVMYVVGGGTNDVLRGEIARGLGLPRW